MSCTFNTICDDLNTNSANLRYHSLKQHCTIRYNRVSHADVLIIRKRYSIQLRQMSKASAECSSELCRLCYSYLMLSDGRLVVLLEIADKSKAQPSG